MIEYFKTALGTLICAVIIMLACAIKDPVSIVAGLAMFYILVTNLADIENEHIGLEQC